MEIDWIIGCGSRLAKLRSNLQSVSLIFQDIMFDMARQWQSLDYMSEVYPDFDPEVHKKKMADIEGTNTHDNDQSESHQS